MKKSNFANMTLGIDPISGLAVTIPDEHEHTYVCGRSRSGKSFFLEGRIHELLLRWSKNKETIVVMEPHGELIDNLVRWLAFHSIDRPIILIDLRRDDWVTGINPLRPRSSIDPAVLVSDLITAITHVWGAHGTDKTPRLARWLANILITLLENNGSSGKFVPKDSKAR